MQQTLFIICLIIFSVGELILAKQSRDSIDFNLFIIWLLPWFMIAVYEILAISTSRRFKILYYVLSCYLGIISPLWYILRDTWHGSLRTCEGPKCISTGDWIAGLVTGVVLLARIIHTLIIFSKIWSQYVRSTLPLT